MLNKYIYSEPKFFSSFSPPNNSSGVLLIERDFNVIYVQQLNDIYLSLHY